MSPDLHPLRLLALLTPLPGAGAAALAEHPDVRVREAVAGNAGTAGPVVARLARDSQQPVRRAALARVQDTGLLVDAVRNGTAEAKVGAAANPLMPASLLADLLTGDPAPGVLRAALANPSTPVDAVIAAAGQWRTVWRLSGTGMGLQVAAAAALRAHPQLVQTWAGWTDPVVRRLVARSLAGGPGVEAFLGAPTRTSLRVLGGNPAVPSDALPARGPAASARRALETALDGVPLREALQWRSHRAALAVLGSPAVDVALATTAVQAGDVAPALTGRSAVLDPDVAAQLAESGWSAAVAVRRSQPRSRVQAATSASPLLRAIAGVNEDVYPLPDLVGIPELVAGLGSDPGAWQVLRRLAEQPAVGLAELLTVALGISRTG